MFNPTLVRSGEQQHFLAVTGGVTCRGFPSIVDEEERLNYKREFDQDHHEYKSLQAELDDINQELAKLDAEMNAHPEGSPQFLVSSPPTP